MSCVLIIVLDVNHLMMGDFLAKIIQPSMHDHPPIQLTKKHVLGIMWLMMLTKEITLVCYTSGKS